jgi:hypothetical protein
MIVVPFRAWHMMAMQLQDSQQWYTSYLTEEYARFFEMTNSFSALVDGVPVFCGGAVELFKERALLWSFVGRHAGEHFIAIHRGVAKFIEGLPYKRLEADCDADFKQGHRWLKSLGFVLEAPRMRAYRMDGGDSSLYAKVK